MIDMTLYSSVKNSWRGGPQGFAAIGESLCGATGAGLTTEVCARTDDLSDPYGQKTYAVRGGPRVPAVDNATKRRAVGR
jgi:hypothetical protein